MGTLLRLTIVSLYLAALSTQTAQEDSHMHMAGRSAADACWSKLQQTMTEMHATMDKVEPSGDTDEDFVKLMLPHHQAAIDMAKTELLYGTDPQMRRLAQEIITDQQSEIELMRLWLKQHSPGRTNAP